MDANGLRFWLLAEADHWRLPGQPPALEYDSRRRALRLARQRRESSLVEDAAQAAARLERVPALRDHQGQRAWYQDGQRRILVAGGNGGEPRPLYSVPGTAAVTDLAVDGEGILYIATAGAVLMHDLRGRWDDAWVAAEGLEPWRLAAAADGGVWVLDRRHRRLARLRGQPQARRRLPAQEQEAARFCQPNPEPPRLEPIGQADWPEAESPVALACNRDGRLACLSWRGDEHSAVLRCLGEDAAWGGGMTLHTSRRPYSLAWLAADKVAVLVCGRLGAEPDARQASEARVYTVAEGAGRYPDGDLYPLKPGYDGGPFLHGPDYPPHYPAGDASHPLRRLSFPFFSRQGEARDQGAARPLDGGEAGTVWHRLYLEAVVPKGCGLRIWLAASDRHPAELEAGDGALEWFPHRLGEPPADGDDGAPSACWLPQASELPHHPGLLPCRREPGRKGLFTVLIQRHGRRVRSLRGRYLHVRVSLHGPGNASPELFALRAYGGRFSYLEHYLPEVYHEQLFAPEADQAGAATAADFLERYLDNMEGLLTLLEDRIAHSDLLTRPQTVPAGSLAWLGGWVGLPPEPGWSEAQQRRFLAHAGELQRYHGTLRGLCLALDIVTDGAVGRGEIVVVEDFRLRRTFATLLGVELEQRDDPLTLGGPPSGNSYLGDSLLLGEEQQQELLALFAAEPGQDETVAAFFDRLAFRVTLLVRGRPGPQLLGKLQRIAEREIPAHVHWRILPASEALLVGIASLVGVDTWLGERPRPQPARVAASRLGHGDYLNGADGFGPPVAGPPPQARASDVEVAFGETLVLDGSASTAAPGRRISRYLWTFEA